MKFLRFLGKLFTYRMHPLVFTAVGIVLFFVIVSFLGFLLVSRPPKITSNVTPAAFHLEYERVAFDAEDGITIRGWFIPHENHENTRAIAVLHGYPADKGNVLPFAARLNEDYHLLLFDFRYLGESDGAYSTLGVRETKDLRAALQFLRSRGIEQVGIWGFSMGGAVALRESAAHEEIAAIVSDSSYARMDLLAKELFRIPLADRPLGLLSAVWGRVILGVDIWAYTPEDGARLLDIPVLVIHSREDEVIPFEHALLLEAALDHNEQAEFWFREGLPHGAIDGEYLSRIQEFFHRHVRP